MDSFLALVDWILTIVLWLGIPLSLTSTIVHHYFTNVKPDSGTLGSGGGGGKGGGGDVTVSSFFKDIIKFIIVAVISWVAIYLVRDLIPAAGSTVVDGLGF